MSDSKIPEAEKPASAPPNADVRMDAKVADKLKPPNPMWKYLGFGENFRPRLPSRNWTIFLAITGTFTAAVIYDKREKKRAQRKWCKVVEHIAKEPLEPRSMPRRLTVFLEGPPTDGLRNAQDHFKEYVKPILVASGLDWEFVQGRKEGDIRAELAEKIRNQRLQAEESVEEQDPILATRRKSGIKEWEGPRGDIVLGRHTWKEYVRGLHEGWLGPLTEPTQPVEEMPETPTSETPAAEITPSTPDENLPGITVHSSADEASPTAPPSEDKPAEEEKPKKPTQPTPFISPSAYSSASLPSSLPSELDPSAAISFPHILGFLNTPQRLYRFLNRRYLADQIGRDTAAIILATYRPYQDSEATSSGPTSESSPETTSEIASLLAPEEAEWHKSIHKRVENEPERTWLEPIVLDPRIASRMRKAELSAEDEEKAKKVVVREEEVEGWIKGGLRSLGRSGLELVGLRKENKDLVRGENDE